MKLSNRNVTTTTTTDTPQNNRADKEKSSHNSKTFCFKLYHHRRRRRHHLQYKMFRLRPDRNPLRSIPSTSSPSQSSNLLTPCCFPCRGRNKNSCDQQRQDAADIIASPELVTSPVVMDDEGGENREKKLSLTIFLIGIDDLVENIFDFVGTTNLVHARRVNRTWKQLIDNRPKKPFTTNQELKYAVKDYTDYKYHLAFYHPRSVPREIKKIFNKIKFIYGAVVGNWDVSQVTDFSFVFYRISFNEPINSWDVSNATNMKGMFAGATYFNQPLSLWDTRNVTNMCVMFCRAKRFDQPLDSWDTSKVTDMRGMLQYTERFNQQLDSWDTSKVTNMSCMFNHSKRFNQPLDSWDTSMVKDMRYMFSGAKSYNQCFAG